MAVSFVDRCTRKLARLFRSAAWRIQDYTRSSYSAAVQEPSGSLSSLGLSLSPALKPWHVANPTILAHYLEHRFDLLGSGWTRVFRGMRCRGTEGYVFPVAEDLRNENSTAWLQRNMTRPNRAYSLQVWKMLDEHYRPIDWQIDFKSGYRWSESTWSPSIRFGDTLGADIKVPWELARMQHLPQLAIAYAAGVSGKAEWVDSKKLVREFQNVVLDFVATNPPRFGVNWVSSNEVAIRISNWLVAYDIFLSAGATFDTNFTAVLAGSALDHGLHIASFPERDQGFSNNHYLANSLGLCAVSACLPKAAIAREWIPFCQAELEREILNQFLRDGGNFEGSTAYHGLSAHIATYAVAFLCRAVECQPVDAVNSFPKESPIGAQKGELQSWLVRKFGDIARFLVDVTKPDGRIVQIGDNDSGRVLKLQPHFRELMVKNAITEYENLSGFSELGEGEIYFDEDSLDYRQVVGAINGLIHDRELKEYYGTSDLDELVVGIIATGKLSDGSVPSPRKMAPAGIEYTYPGMEAWNEALQKTTPRTRSFKFERPQDISKIKFKAYPDFGVFIYTSEGFFLSVRCGPRGQKGKGGHDHNDQLSIELQISGKDVFLDPGCYLYSPIPDRRNEYRSVHSHWTPVPTSGSEPGDLALGLFGLGNPAAGECLVAHSTLFVGRYMNSTEFIYRKIEILPEELVIADLGGLEPPLPHRPVTPWRPGMPSLIAYSPGYGKRKRLENRK